MILKIIDNNELIIKEGIYYLGLSEYSQVQDWNSSVVEYISML